MKENKLKKQVLYFMLLAKLIVISYIWLNKNTGGFTTDQAISAITLTIPLFTVYLSAIYKELVQQKIIAKEKDKILNKSFKNLTYVTLFIYFFIIIGVVTLKSNGTFDFKQFQSTLAAVESGFGVYVGQIIFSLLKKEN